MKALNLNFRRAMSVAAAALLPAGLLAQGIDFAEFDGSPDNTPIAVANLPQGLPDGVRASWVGLQLHTAAGDTPMSVFPTGDRAVLAFTPPVIISSINAFDTSWGDPMTVIGKLRGLEVWRYESPGDHDWKKLTMGAGKEVDSIVFLGKWNHYDDIILEAAPDSDFDGYTDAEEIAAGHDPFDFFSNPAATAIANSIEQFSGVQGENDWFWGYRNFTKDGGGATYNPTTGFIPFAEEAWTGGAWDLNTAASAPWTELGRVNTHPNAGSGDTHWTIRRWVANQLTTVTPLALRWHAHHANAACGGNGITSGLYRNGQPLDVAVIAAPDNVGVTRTYYVNASPGDRFDLILSAAGTDGIESDGCDGSENWFLVDTTIPNRPIQPDGSIFVPVGTGDSDNDGLPDVWEWIFFPNDLTKLSRTGDFDNDGLSDLAEYERGSDPTKPDTDGDGLSDLVETGTGIFVSKNNTGSSPTKVDSDGDGLSDFFEVNRVPPTDPNKSDTDGDGYSDPDEIAWGTDPTDPQDTPTTYVIANSRADFSGTQGKDDWFNGYRIFDPQAGGSFDYNPNLDFIPFPGGAGQGEWDGFTQLWTGSAWDLNTAAAGPWTQQGQLDVHPNGANSPSEIGGASDPNNEHWAIRRWVAKKLTKDTPVTIIWQVRKTNLSGSGVTGMIFVNGKLADSKSIPGNDSAGEIRRHRVTLKPNDIVDLALSPEGPNGDRHDGSDGSQTWFWVDTRAAAPATPALSVTRSASGITLTFTGTLQVADQVQGPYTDVNSSGSVTVAFSSGAVKFYRARQ
jgi:hypothetical protein